MKYHKPLKDLFVFRQVQRENFGWEGITLEDSAHINDFPLSSFSVSIFEKVDSKGIKFSVTILNLTKN